MNVETRVLDHLHDHVDGDTVPDMATALGIDRSRVYSVIDALMRQGLVLYDRERRPRGFQHVRPFMVYRLVRTRPAAA